MYHVDLDFLLPQPVFDLVLKARLRRFISKIDDFTLCREVVWVVCHDKAMLVGVDAVVDGQPKSNYIDIFGGDGQNH